MSSDTATTNSPTTDMQVKNKQTGSSGKKSHSQEDTFEKLSVVVRMGDRRQLLDLELARRREAERKLKMLDVFAQEEFEKKQLRSFARARFVPERVLTTWKHDYLLHGFEGLLPQDWAPLTEKVQGKVLERLEILGELTDAVTITGDDVHKLSKKFDAEGRFRVAERLVRRYQIDGVWGLAPERDPERIHRPRNRVPPIEYAAASPKKRAEADRRLALITPFIKRRRIPNDELKEHAKKHSTEEHPVSWRTLRYYLAKYKKWGLAGLLPKEERSDKGHPHNMSELMEDIIAALRYSQMDIPLHEVLRQACQRAHLLGEPEPTLWQVRYVCDRIPEEVKLYADKRFGEFRSKRRLTYRFQFDGSVIIYQIDFTQVDVLVRDIRRRGYRKPSEELRPYLITCIESSSRLVLAWLFTYDVPNSNNIAAVIREALIATDEKPYGGVPHAIWVDQGEQLISHHIQQIAQDLEFELKDGKPNFPEDRGDPQKRGIEERFFETAKTRLWSTLQGYVDSNTKERNPNAQAVLTISELAEKFREFIDTYHHKKHSETGMTPLEFWAKNCQARTPPDLRELDILLLVKDIHTLNKHGINYGNRRYWHQDLAEIPVGSKVEIRAQPDYMRPDAIEVFYQKRWICSAFAHDSVKGRAVTGKQVLQAQREQRKRIRGEINEKQSVLHNADQRIKSQGLQNAQEQGGEQTQVSDQQSQKQRHESVTRQTARPVASQVQSKTYVPLGSPSSSKQRNAAWEKALVAKKRQQQRQAERSKQ